MAWFLYYLPYQHDVVRTRVEMLPTENFIYQVMHTFNIILSQIIHSHLIEMISFYSFQSVSISTKNIIFAHPRDSSSESLVY